MTQDAQPPHNLYLSAGRATAAALGLTPDPTPPAGQVAALAAANLNVTKDGALQVTTQVGAYFQAEPPNATTNDRWKFTGGGLALADVDPPGCTRSATSQTINLFRADGLTPITSIDTVSDGELIRYQAVLEPGKLPSGAIDPTACAYSGGAWTLTTPNGQTTNLAAALPGGVVPRIGGQGVARLASVSASRSSSWPSFVRFPGVSAPNSRSRAQKTEAPRHAPPPRILLGGADAAC